MSGWRYGLLAHHLFTKFMKMDEFKKQLDEEARVYEAKPWFVRKILDSWWFFRYRAAQIPREKKWQLQAKFRGYSDCDIWNLNDFIVQTVYPPLKKFVEYEKEHGMALPFDFEKDPAGWLTVLDKILFAFEETWKENNDMDYGLDVVMKKTPEERTEYYGKIQEGFELFGKYCRNLWD